MKRNYQHGWISGVSLTLAQIFVTAQTVPAPDRSKSPGDTKVEWLDPFEVSSTRDKGYGSTSSMGGSRINVASENYPMTVISITPQFLQDVGASYPLDALQYVSGVNVSNEYYSGSAAVRGYGINTYDYRDGLPDQTGDSGGDFQSMSMIERVEIVKGPAGVEFGATSLGGIINLVTKKPLAYRQTIFRTSIESFNTYNAIVDFNDVGTSDKKLRYRVIAEYNRGNTQADTPIKRWVINPTITYQVSDQTKLWGRFDYEEAHYQLGTSLIADFAGNISFFLPRETLQHKGDFYRNVWKYKYELGHSTALEMFGSTWNMRIVGRYNHWVFNFPQTQLTTAWLVNAAGVRFANTTQPAGLFSNPNWKTISIDRNIRTELRYEDNVNFNFDLANEQKFRGMNNTFVTYMFSNYKREDQNRLTYAYVPIDVFNRVQVDNPWSLARFSALTFDQRITNLGFAGGAQDNARFLDDRLILVAGGRWDWGWQNTADKTRNPRTEDGGNAQEWTFKYGIVGKPVPGLSLFYNHSETFAPQVGTLRGTTQALRNLEGVSDEVGTKVEFFDGHLSGTVSAFDMKLNNFVILPPGDAQGRLPPGTQEGVNKTKGWEVDVAYQPIPSVALIFAYGDLTSVDTNGKAQRGVTQGPNYKGFGKYTVLNGPAKGLAVGVGYVYVNTIPAVTSDLFRIPAHGAVNTFTSYNRNNWRLQLNVDNATNKDYALGSSSQTGEVNRANPRTFKLIYTLTFK